MTTSTHTHTATIDDTTLPIRSGRVVLDASLVPHVEAEITIALPGGWVTDSPWSELTLITDTDGVYAYEEGAPGGDSNLTLDVDGVPAYEAGADDVTLLADLDGQPAAVPTPTAQFMLAGVPHWVPDAAVIDALDPRQSPPPRMLIQCSRDDDATVASFDLHIRDRSVVHRDGTITLTLASDEGLLEDYAPLADDDTPFDLASSLRDVVDYVLGEAIPGAQLEASPSIDADVTPRWEQTNLILNARGATSTDGWVKWVSDGVDGTLTTGTTSIVQEGASFGSYLRLGVTSAGTGNAELRYGNTVEDSPTVIPGRLYTFSAWVHQTSGVTKNGRLLLTFRNGAYTALPGASRTISVPTDTWTKISVTAVAPVNAEYAVLTAGISNGMPASSAVGVTAAVLTEGARNDRWFDGSRADETTYTYDYTPDAGTTPSIRVPVGDAIEPEALTWKAGQSALEFLHPLLQAQGLRLVCDGQRKWTLRDEHYTAPGSLDLRVGVNLVTADEIISRDSGIWFDARVTRYLWTDRYGIQRERTDSYALTTPYTRLTTLEVESAYPGPGRSEYAVRRAQGVGRELVTTSVSRWTATAEQSIAVTLPDSPAQVGTIRAVTFDLDTDEMTVTTRTRELPDGAVDLLLGAINDLTGTVNEL